MVYFKMLMSTFDWSVTCKFVLTDWLYAVHNTEPVSARTIPSRAVII